VRVVERRRSQRASKFCRSPLVDQVETFGKEHNSEVEVLRWHQPRWLPYSSSETWKCFIPLVVGDSGANGTASTLVSVSIPLSDALEWSFKGRRLCESFLLRPLLGQLATTTIYDTCDGRQGRGDCVHFLRLDVRRLYGLLKWMRRVKRTSGMSAGISAARTLTSAATCVMPLLYPTLPAEDTCTSPNHWGYR